MTLATLGGGEGKGQANSNPGGVGRGVPHIAPSRGGGPLRTLRKFYCVLFGGFPPLFLPPKGRRLKSSTAKKSEHKSMKKVGLHGGLLGGWVGGGSGDWRRALNSRETHRGRRGPGVTAGKGNSPASLDKVQGWRSRSCSFGESALRECFLG